MGSDERSVTDRNPVGSDERSVTNRNPVGSDERSVTDIEIPWVPMKEV